MAVLYHYAPLWAGQLQIIGFDSCCLILQASSRRGYLTAPILLYDYLTLILSNDSLENLVAYHIMLPKENIHILCPASISILICIN